MSRAMLVGALIFAGASPVSYAESNLSQTDIVAALSGADEISPSIRLNDRRSSRNKQLVRSYLTEQLRNLGLSPASQAYGTGENIYATISATNPSANAIVIGAHFDSVSRSPGANDNATGVAMMFGVAAYLSKQECMSRDVIVVFFDEEETGLLGSQNFASFLQASGKSVHSVHTVDQVGWDRDGDRALELELPTPELEQIYRTVAQERGYTMPLHRTSTSSTDHSSFRKVGYAAVGITEEYVNGDTTPHYHRSTDTFDTVDFAYLEDSTNFVNDVMGYLTACQDR